MLKDLISKYLDKDIDTAVIESIIIKNSKTVLDQLERMTQSEQQAFFLGCITMVNYIDK